MCLLVRALLQVVFTPFARLCGGWATFVVGNYVGPVLTFNYWLCVATIQGWSEPVRRAGSVHYRFLGYLIHYGLPETIRESKRVSCGGQFLISGLHYFLVSACKWVLEFYLNLLRSTSELVFGMEFLFAAGLRKTSTSTKTLKLVFLRPPSGTRLVCFLSLWVYFCCKCR